MDRRSFLGLFSRTAAGVGIGAVCAPVGLSGVAELAAEPVVMLPVDNLVRLIRLDTLRWVDHHYDIDQIIDMKESISRAGVVMAVGITPDRRVWDGVLRIKGALALGMDTVPCIAADRILGAEKWTRVICG